MLSDRCQGPSQVPLVHLGWGHQREANPESPIHGLGSSNSQEQGPSPPPLGGRRKGAEWLSGMIFPICDVAVARRLGLYPEQDGEEQHDEEEEDGATDSQGHDHLCVRGPACQLALLLPILGHDGLCEVQEVLQRAAVRAARQDQRPGSLVTLIPEVHLH